ncbi:MAG: SAP domain-containing protein [Desulfovibrio sp.]|nr:SAP domain-containing protein [Desulfovibrio sp.]MBI4960381.1 SAP domain-containing protein [Desulfovibrio sp.]
MNMQDIRRMAKDKGARISNMNKVDAIRMIQLTEGNFDCFARADSGHCDQGDCLFMEDCIKISMKSN